MWAFRGRMEEMVVDKMRGWLRYGDSTNGLHITSCGESVF